MAYNLGYDVVVDDNSIKDIKNSFKTQTKDLEDIIQRLEKTMKSIIDKGISEGDLHDSMEVYYQESIQKLKTDLQKATGTIESELNSFLKDFDKADGYLYYSK